MGILDDFFGEDIARRAEQDAEKEKEIASTLTGEELVNGLGGAAEAAAMEVTAAVVAIRAHPHLSLSARGVHDVLQPIARSIRDLIHYSEEARRRLEKESSK